MSAREWPDDALKAMHQAMFEDAYDGTNLPLLGAGADAFATALAAAGYRILAPGEMDRETLEAAAKVAETHIIALKDDMCDTDWWVNRIANMRTRRIAAAIRALGGQP